MLIPELERLWAAYLDAEVDRIRAVTMPAIDRFIDALLARPREEWTRWAKDVAAAVADRGEGVPIRFPLFRRVLLPVLAAGVRQGEPGCARWLAHFEPLLVHTPGSDLLEHLQTAHGLLREAARVDPTDELARRRLVRVRADYLEYTLHELPAGVLYDRDGATVGGCDELLSELAEFREHLAATGQAAEYGRLVAECDFHYRAYRDYLTTGRPGGSYGRYLASVAGGG